MQTQEQTKDNFVNGADSTAPSRPGVVAIGGLIVIVVGFLVLANWESMKGFFGIE